MIIILETQPLESPKHQTTIFVDSNGHVTPNHTFDQTYDIVSPRTKACQLLGTSGKPNKTTTSKKRCLFKESLSIAKTIKEYSQIVKELEFLKMQILTQILESEQVGRKLLVEGQLPMVALFAKVLKPQNAARPSSSTCGNI
jgi:hypothetical protein